LAVNCNIDLAFQRSIAMSHRSAPANEGRPAIFKRLWLDERGAVLSFELILLLAITVIGIALGSVGTVGLANSLIAKFRDVAGAADSLDATYTTSALAYTGNSGNTNAWVGRSDGTPVVTDSRAVAPLDGGYLTNGLLYTGNTTRAWIVYSDVAPLETDLRRVAPLRIHLVSPIADRVQKNRAL
jgi:hypothetical protein